MTLIELVIILILIGAGLYVINTVLPIDRKFKTIINVVVVIVACLWLLEVFGLVGGSPIHLNSRIR
jgi:cytochrome c biogenesis protein CcdA